LSVDADVMTLFLHKKRGLMGHKGRGFTLIELLVSLLVFSIAMGLMSGALFQSAKLLEQIERGNDRLIDEWRSMRSLQEAVANMRALPKAGSTAAAPTAFSSGRGPLEGMVGDAERFSVWTTRHPLAEQGRVLKLDARVEAAQGRSDAALRVQAPPRLDSRFAASSSAPAQGTDSVLAVLPRTAALRYQDIEGGWHASWPPQGRERELLPRAVSLIDADGAKLLAVWSFQGQTVESELRGGSFFTQLEGPK
jgi:prepilin-type N-terminal cleavage/methylation domain-containing protein